MGFSRASSSQAVSCSIFTTIPPERIGLDGDYDHHGLAHRVERAFEQRFGPQLTQALKITQRGSVVVIIGDVLPQAVVPQMMDIAMSISGTTDVELNGVSLSEPLRCILD
jgi:hypothetical protein